ncbi:MAG: hypothetical protein D6B25_06295, partial [Desulfobulbaceae bacterium]
PVKTLQFFFTLLGSYLHYNPFAMVAGGLSLFFFLILTVKRYDQRNPVIYYLALLVILTIGAVTATRSGFGIQQALISRYAVMSTFLLVLLYLAFIDFLCVYSPIPLRSERLRKVMVVSPCIGAMLFWGATVVPGKKYLSRRHNGLTERVENWHRIVDQQTTEIGKYERKVIEAIERGRYALPSID